MYLTPNKLTKIGIEKKSKAIKIGKFLLKRNSFTIELIENKKINTHINSKRIK